MLGVRVTFSAIFYTPLDRGMDVLQLCRWKFPYNISATAGASDFKFGKELGFANAHHKTTPRGKVGVTLG